MKCSQRCILFFCLSLFVLFVNVVNGQLDWTKYENNPILNLGEQGEWNDQYVGSPCVIFDGILYHMWFEGVSNATNKYNIGYATSNDGIEWIPYENNPVFSTSDGKWDADFVASPYVLLIDSVFHMWYTGGNFSPYKIGIGYAISHDGTNWERHENNPILSPNPVTWEGTTVQDPIVQKTGLTYHMWYDNNYRIGYATSQNGITWEKHEGNPVLEPEELGALLVRPSQVLDMGDHFKMWFNYGTYSGQIGYAESVDGVNWQLYEGNPVLAFGKAGEWDDNSILSCCVFINENEYKMFYTGENKAYYYSIGCATSVQVEHDLRTISLFDSLSQVPLWCKCSFTPTMKIGNNGLSDEFNFAVNCTIDSAGIPIHHETIVVDSLKGLSLKLKEISFQEYNIEPLEECIYNISYYTTLVSDQNLFNDTMKTSIIASNQIDNFEMNISKWIINNSGTEISSAFVYNGNSSLNIKYENTEKSWAEFKYSFNLSQLTNAYLSFWSKFFFELNKDYGFVEISSDGGNSWEKIGEILTGFNPNFEKKVINLEGYCGNNFDDVRLRFTIEPDSNVVLPGWFIDDVSIHSGQVPTSVYNQEKVHNIADKFLLLENYPNPFNAETVITYQLPIDDDVKLEIFNLLGKKIATLINRNHQAGLYQVIWNGKDDFGQYVASGLYIYKMETKIFSDSRKLLFLK